MKDESEHLHEPLNCLGHLYNPPVDDGLLPLHLALEDLRHKRVNELLQPALLESLLKADPGHLHDLLNPSGHLH